MYKKLQDEMYEGTIQRDYIGVIEDNEDPDFEGKARVRVFGIHGDPEGEDPFIDTEDLPWAFPEMNNTFGGESGAGNFSTPKLNAKVLIRFDMNVYYPKYVSLVELNVGMKELFTDDNYENAHVMAFDEVEELRMFYNKELGFLIDLKGSIINIKNDNSLQISHANESANILMEDGQIDINTNDAIFMAAPNNIDVNSNELNLSGVQTNVGANPIFSAVNGEPIMTILKAMATAIDAKLPVSPGATAGIVNAGEATILSQTVTTTP